MKYMHPADPPTCRHAGGAFAKADRAQQLLDENPATALQAIESAIRQEPREPLFYGIRGKTPARQGRNRAAIRAFDAATRRDTGFDEHDLGRGLSHDHLGQQCRARRDLERSSNLLPTAEVSFSLAGIALDEGDRQKNSQRNHIGPSAGREANSAGRRVRLTSSSTCLTLREDMSPPTSTSMESSLSPRRKIPPRMNWRMS